MNDIERELKLVQLQRERLALESELKSRKWKASAINAAPRAALWAVNGVRTVITIIGSAFTRWWKMGTLGAISTVAIVGTFTWMESVKQAKQDAAEARYEAEVQKIVLSECGSANCSLERDADCWNTMNQHPTCSRRVREAIAIAEEAKRSVRIVPSSK